MSGSAGGFTDLIFGINPAGSTIGALRLDVLASETIEFPSTVTDYPVEDDSPMSDGILTGTSKLSVNGSVSATSATVLGGLLSGGLPSPSKLLDAVHVLESIWAAHTTITIVTGLGVYQNMGMSGCRVMRSKDGPGGKWLDIQCEFSHIRKVSLKYATVPNDATSGKTGTTKASAGKATTTDPTATTATKGTTILHSLAKSIGF